MPVQDLVAVGARSAAAYAEKRINGGPPGVSDRSTLLTAVGASRGAWRYLSPGQVVGQYRRSLTNEEHLASGSCCELQIEETNQGRGPKSISLLRRAQTQLNESGANQYFMTEFESSLTGRLDDCPPRGPCFSGRMIHN